MTKSLFVLGLAFAVAGCRWVTSGANSANTETGEFWYVVDSPWSSSKVFYCPPQPAAGRGRCVQATMVHEPDDNPSVAVDPTQYSQHGTPPPGNRTVSPGATAPVAPTPAPSTPAAGPAPEASATAPAPPSTGETAPPPPSPPGACSTDAECKRGRVCRAGACTSP